MRTVHWFVLAAGLGLACPVLQPLAAQEKPIPAAAEELKQRVTALALLPNGTLASGSTFGVVLWDVQPIAAVSGPVTWGTRARPGGFLLPDAVSGMALRGTTLAVAHGAAGLTLLDASDPTRILLFANLLLPGAAIDVIVDPEPTSTLLWVPMGTMGIACVDTADQAKPKLLSVIDTGGYVRHLAVKVFDKGSEQAKSGLVRRLWVAAGKKGLLQVDLGPQNAVLKTTILAQGTDIKRVVRFGDGMLYSQGSKGLCYLAENQVLDLEAQDSQHGSCLESHDVVRDLLVVGNKVYAADGGAGVLAADFSDPLHPKYLGHLADAKFSANRLMLVDDLLVIAADAAGVVAFPTSSLP